MKFNIWFTLRGPNGEVEAPNNTNPVDCENLASLLSGIANDLPTPMGIVETVGVRIAEVKQADEAGKVE